MKIPMKAITITYTKTWSVVPESHMFEDWDVEPSQEGFEDMMLDEFFDDILENVGGKGTLMDHTDVKRFEDVVVNWGEDDA